MGGSIVDVDLLGTSGWHTREDYGGSEPYYNPEPMDLQWSLEGQGLGFRV